MEQLTRASKLTVFVGGDERRDHRPLYELVVEILREHRVTGVTLMKGAMSYGGRDLIHSEMNEITMNNLPIIIEAVGVDESIWSAADHISSILGPHGLVQVQPTTIVLREKGKS
jgi:hypothetical protein